MSIRPKDHCYVDLQKRILTLDIAPGADLDEVSLSNEYAISRTPLREVLQKLSGEGYLTLTNHRGAKVASMDLPVLRSFFQTAPLIYCSIARLAAERHKEVSIEPLCAIQRDFEQAVDVGDTIDMALANHRFHDQIGVMAGNTYLLPSFRRLLIDHARLGQTFFRPTDPDEQAAVQKACRQHQAMMSAIEAGQADEVVNLTMQHWDLSRDRMERFVQPDPLPRDFNFNQERRDAV